MYTFLMILFIFLSFFLAGFILIQQGKGDFGLSGIGGQMLFGGSGGQEFFEKATWIMGAIFIFGSLGLSIIKSKEDRASILDGARATDMVRQLPAKRAATETAPVQQAADDYDAQPMASADTLNPSPTTATETPAAPAEQTPAA
jgi:protein translocase SecG subunit